MKKTLAVVLMASLLAGCAPQLESLNPDAQDVLAQSVKTKDPGLAAAMSAISPGSGLIYAGKVQEGMAVQSKLGFFASLAGLGIAVFALGLDLFASGMSTGSSGGPAVDLGVVGSLGGLVLGTTGWLLYGNYKSGQVIDSYNAAVEYDAALLRRHIALEHSTQAKAN